MNLFYHAVGIELGLKEFLPNSIPTREVLNFCRQLLQYVNLLMVQFKQCTDQSLITSFILIFPKLVFRRILAINQMFPVQIQFCSYWQPWIGPVIGWQVPVIVEMMRPHITWPRPVVTRSGSLILIPNCKGRAVTFLYVLSIKCLFINQVFQKRLI